MNCPKMITKIKRKLKLKKVAKLRIGLVIKLDPLSITKEYLKTRNFLRKDKFQTNIRV
jgi:hypothetical protein